MDAVQLGNSLVGIAGEYYVCAEICRRGNLALITPKNNPLYDVVATNPRGTRSIAIQVKTRSPRNTQGWKFGQNMASEKGNRELYVVLVSLGPAGSSPEFFVYQFDDLARRVARHFERYLGKKKRDGTDRKDPGFRWFDTKNFEEDDRSRKNCWDLIQRALHDDNTEALRKIAPLE